MQEGRREGPYTPPLAEAGELRRGLTLASAADITYALASADTFRALVDDWNWSWNRSRIWITAQLSNALLEPEGHGPGERPHHTAA